MWCSLYYILLIFYYIEPIPYEFENLNILGLRVGDLNRLVRPHSLHDHSPINLTELSLLFSFHKQTFVRIYAGHRNK
jgi:hypothetical protein